MLLPSATLTCCLLWEKLAQFWPNLVFSWRVTDYSSRLWQHLITSSITLAHILALNIGLLLADGHHRTFSLMHFYFYLLCRCLFPVFFSHFQAPFHFFFPFSHLGILELKSQKPFRPLSFAGVFFLSAVKMEPLFFFGSSCNKLISPSLCAPSFFLICVNKAASGAWKRRQGSRAYGRALFSCSM